METAIYYKPFNEKATYEAYCELLSDGKTWRISFCEELSPKTTMLIDLNLKWSSDINTFYEYLKEFGAKKVWWRLHCGETYHTLDYIKRVYGDWESLNYINNYNKYLHQLLKDIGFTEMVQVSSRENGRIVTKNVPRWKLISSHTARRTAITNAVVRGQNLHNVKRCSGHASLDMVDRYVKDYN